MDAGDDEGEALQHLVRIVERAVGEDVGLDALRSPEVPSETLVQPVGLVVLLFICCTEWPPA